MADKKNQKNNSEGRGSNQLTRGERLILDELRESNRLAKENRKLLYHIFRSMTSHRVSGGVMSRVENAPMNPITPGSSPVFQVTPTPAGVVTKAANAKWSSADPTNFPVTMNADDPTGLTATVAVASGAAVGSEVELTWQYTNDDNSVVTVNGSFPVVAAAPPPPTDVTGGTMAQIA